MQATGMTPRILVVCTGNVCRSPYIERRLRAGLDSAWGPGAVVVHSAGSGALVGSAMDPGSASLLGTAGLPHEDFIARSLTRDLVADASLVITATRAHRSAVTRLHPRALRTTHALRDLAHIAAGTSLPDRSVDETPASWLGKVVPLLAARRGMEAPLPEDVADVVDPYRRPESVFAEMASQIDACIPPVLTVLCPPR